MQHGFMLNYICLEPGTFGAATWLRVVPFFGLLDTCLTHCIATLDLAEMRVMKE